MSLGRTWVKSRVSESAWTKVYRTEALAEQGNGCAYCFAPLTAKCATADHKKARSKGGTTEKENIKAACAPCNTAKGSNSEAAFKRRIKNPEPGDSILIWLAWSRRRIWLATRRACKRIAESVG
jgi:5-methylcytosine-specific restriction endonuclease McrA